MRAIFSPLRMALLAALAMPAAMVAAEPHFVDFNYDIARSYAADGMSFLPEAQVPAHALLSMDANFGALQSGEGGGGGGGGGGSTSTTDYTACSVTQTNVTDSDSSVTVLIAVSKCLGDTALAQIKTWAATLQNVQSKFFQNGQARTIKYVTAVVPGSCQAISEANAQGQASMLLSDDVLPGDLERFTAFNEIGRVLTTLPTTNITNKGVDASSVKTVDSTVPIAVVSFVDNYKSFESVQQYELTEKITATFNFQICQNGENCGGTFADCIVLQDAVDVFMYSPFKMVSKFECANLKGGIPVTYVNDNNVRKCACTCPAGTKLAANSNVKTCDAVPDDTCKCVWANALNGGYKVLIDTPSTETTFTNVGTKGNIPAPVAVDNYVAKDRKNQNDDNSNALPLASGPHIDLKSTRTCKSVYTLPRGASTTSASLFDSEFSTIKEFAKLSDGAKKVLTLFSAPECASTPTTTTTTYKWKDYRGNRDGAINGIKFPGYGRYALELIASDYNKTATCPGCVVIVDSYRPRGDPNKCPKRFCDHTLSDCTADEGVAELTSTNLASAKSLVDAFYKFESASTNDACSKATSERCDVNTITYSAFKSSNAALSYDSGKDFFSTDVVKADLKSKLTLDGSLNCQQDTPVANGECKRCLNVATELGEFWTDYSCDRDYDIRRCQGHESGKCSFKQCLVVLGDSVAAATASLNPSVVAESKKVVAELTQQGYNTDTQAHVALACTAFKDNADPKAKAEPGCQYTSKVESLIDVGADTTAKSIFTKAEASGFVFWRYRVDTKGKWIAWGSAESTAIVFEKAETMITLEAWTQCGLVRKFYFYVNLHLNNNIDVCGNFRSMWYQTTNDKLDAPDELCLYPKSDFAELTFDYHANVGLEYSPDKLLMNISSVVCRMSYDALPALTGVEILNVQAISPEIVTRFAIESVRAPTTLPKTKFHVTCEFTYKRYGAQAPVSQICNQDFSIRDCTGPEIDRPCLDDNCPADTCVGKSDPAPYEACGGNIVSAGTGAKALFTPASTKAKSCCDFCSGKYETTCTTLSSLPAGESDIKRCEPVKKPTTGTTPSGGSYPTAQLLAAAEALKMRAAQSPAGAATVLLSASALVALVALVVVKRRGAHAASNTHMEDAYYPLLN